MNVLDPTTWSWSALLEPTLAFAASTVKEKMKVGLDVALGSVRNRWEQFGWQSAESAYRDSLERNLSTTKVLGNPKPIQITKIYTDVYVHDLPSAMRHFSGDLTEDSSLLLCSRPNRVSALSIAKTGKNMFILGRPGAGKTTLLRYLAILACGKKIDRVPIFISLKEWSDSSQAILPFIASQFDICGFPDAEAFVRALLSKGSALLLLDGLDEVSDAGSKRAQAIREVVNLAKKYRKCQYCLTCRTASTDYSFEQFSYVEIADFTAEQQQNFVRLWYRDEPSMLQRFEEGWAEEHQDGLRELGKTPLLLALLCLSFDQTLQFPVRQVDLYKEALDALLRKWDASRLIVRDEFYRKLSPSRREHLFEHIASKFYFAAKVAFRAKELEFVVLDYLKALPEKESALDADAATVIRQIESQHGILVERAIGIYSFSHLTIQEYLTASFIIKSQHAKSFEQLATLGLQDPKWREVVLFAAGLLPSADELLAVMANKLNGMLEADAGTLKFLALSWCEVAIQQNVNRKAGQIIPVGRYDAHDLRSLILAQVDSASHPPLTNAEVKMVAEHLLWIRDFVRRKEIKYNFGLVSGITRQCAEIVSESPSKVAKLLGGYFARPDAFISYLYGCRMLIESLEVAVASERAKYLSKIMTLEEQALDSVAYSVGLDRF